jgi:hypothetical protein
MAHDIRRGCTTVIVDSQLLTVSKQRHSSHSWDQQKPPPGLPDGGVAWRPIQVQRLFFSLAAIFATGFAFFLAAGRAVVTAAFFADTASGKHGRGGS